jgi:hypothetical protein
VEQSSVYVFGDLHQGAYLSRYTRHQSIVLNNIPTPLLVSYVPSQSSVHSKQNSATSLGLEPLWRKDLFSEEVSTLSVPLEKLKGVSNVTIASREKEQLITLPILKRKKPVHLEFFPTGFVITAIPTLLTIVGLTSFATYKVGYAAFRLGRQYYERR